MTAIFPSVVAGELVGEDGKLLTVASPYDGAVAGQCHELDRAGAQRMIDAAVAAQAAGRRMPAHLRSALCREISDQITARAEELAKLITAESGKPINYAKGEVARGASTFMLAASEALDFPRGEVMPLDVIGTGEGYHGHATRVAAGPVLGICPFNFPLNLVAHKVAPALAVGCPVVIKPAPQAPLTALVLGQIFLAAAKKTGADPRLLQVAPMSVEVAGELVTSDAFVLLSFTGSAAVGWNLKATCGRKRITLELGGNAPTIVHADADFDHAVQRCVLGSFASAGQVCIKTQRIMVHRQIYLRFRAAFLEKAAMVAVGDPADPATIVGPVIDGRSADRIATWVDEAIAEGARSLLLRRREGNIVWPVVLEEVPPQARVAREEVFGPVVTLEPYDLFEDALERANEGNYGLQAGVFTRDVERAHQAAQELEYGGVIINDVPMFRVDNFPYGGVKSSGLGREGVRYAMEDMSELRMVVFRSLPKAKAMPKRAPALKDGVEAAVATGNGGLRPVTLEEASLSPTDPETVAVVGAAKLQCHEDSDPQIPMRLGESWGRMLSKGDPGQIADLYAADAVLLATFQNNLNTPEGIRAYFEMLMRNPKLRVRIDSMTARDYAPNVVSLSGLYTFLYDDENGKPVEVSARYHFIWENRDTTWLIVEHHSSVCPETDRPSV